MAVERSPLDKSGSRRGFGLPIAAWLVLGFAMVIGAFVAASLFALRSTRHATADVTRVQQEFEPLARKAREFGDRAATFDRAVLGYLRTYSEESRQAVADAGVSISDVVNEPSWADAGARTAGFKDAVARLASHQAEGFSLLDLQDRRNRAADALESTLTSLENRIGTSGAAAKRWCFLALSPFTRKAPMTAKRTKAASCRRWPREKPSRSTSFTGNSTLPSRRRDTAKPAW